MIRQYGVTANALLSENGLFRQCFAVLEAVFVTAYATKEKRMAVQKNIPAAGTDFTEAHLIRNLILARFKRYCI